MELKNEKRDERGNLLYYEKDNGDTRIFKYDGQNRLTYYGEDGKYDMWKEYSADGGYCVSFDNQGNKRYFRINCHNAEKEIPEEEFDEQRFKEALNPDKFKFELMDI